MNNNNDNTVTSHMPEPTLTDIFNLLQNCASKNDLDTIKSQIITSNTETAEKVNNIEDKVNSMKDTQQQHADKIQSLEINLELLKQEQLKNNVCISGIPDSIIKSENNTSKIVSAIAKSLNVDINMSQFSSYAVAGNKFIITHFYNLKYKQMLLNKIRIKKSLMVEEVFQSVRSNSQVYLNDHLTPYFNKLYLMARNAKKQGFLASASSYGGKIRARKNVDDVPSLITSESQLQSIIDSDMSLNTTQHTNNDSIANSTVVDESPTQSTENRKNRSSKTSTLISDGTNAGTSGSNGKNANNIRGKHRGNNNNAPGKGKRSLDTSGTAVDPSKKSKVPKHKQTN